MKYVLLIILLICNLPAISQKLALRKRSSDALSGSEFVKILSDSTLSLAEREKIIFNEVKSGNIPSFLRHLTEIRDTVSISGKIHNILYFVLPDFIAIGSNEDYFYCPMRPQLAQKIADMLKCSLPTRKISDKVFEQAVVKLTPQPIPPSKAMITVPVFEKHNLMVYEQRKNSLQNFPLGTLVAGNKKDVVISNKIYTPDMKSRVVIYGWHKPEGKAIQPLYNGHTSDHVDYSHGIRLIQNKLWVNGKRSYLKNILQSEDLHPLLSDEGMISKAYYPVE